MSIIFIQICHCKSCQKRSPRPVTGAKQNEEIPQHPILLLRAGTDRVYKDSSCHVFTWKWFNLDPSRFLVTRNQLRHFLRLWNRLKRMSQTGTLLMRMIMRWRQRRMTIRRSRARRSKCELVHSTQMELNIIFLLVLLLYQRLLKTINMISDILRH